MAKQGKRRSWEQVLQLAQELTKKGVSRRSIGFELGLDPHDFKALVLCCADLKVAIAKGKAEREVLAADRNWAIINQPDHKHHYRAVRDTLVLLHEKDGSQVVLDADRPAGIEVQTFTDDEMTAARQQ